MPLEKCYHSRRLAGNGRRTCPSGDGYIDRIGVVGYSAIVPLYRIDMKKRVTATSVAAWASHILAWVVGIFLAFGPVYSVSSNSLIEQNGLDVIWLLLVPVLLTGVALLAVKRASASRFTRFILLWGTAVMLMGFCAVSILSIGALYLPAAVALVFTAFTNSRNKADGF